MYNTHTHTAGTRSADLHPGQDGGSNPPRERESLLLWFVQLEAANMNIYGWHARTHIHTDSSCLPVSLSILIHEVERYIRFIHNDPWAKSSSSSGAVYQWKWAKRKSPRVCRHLLVVWRQKKEPTTSAPGEKKETTTAQFSNEKPQNKNSFWFKTFFFFNGALVIIFKMNQR